MHPLIYRRWKPICLKVLQTLIRKPKQIIGYVVSIKSIIPAKITISTSDSLDIDSTYIETPTVTAIPVTKFRD